MLCLSCHGSVALVLHKQALGHLQQALTAPECKLNLTCHCPGKPPFPIAAGSPAWRDNHHVCSYSSTMQIFVLTLLYLISWSATINFARCHSRCGTVSAVGKLAPILPCAPTLVASHPFCLGQPHPLLINAQLSHFPCTCT